MTATDLVVVDPIQGEVLELRAASAGRLGSLLTDVRDREQELRDLKRLVNDELHRRMDADRHWTMHLEDGMVLTGQSDALREEWDADALAEELDQLVAAGDITPDARNRAVQTRIELKVLAAGVKALLKNEDIAARLEPHRRLVAPDARYVKVARATTRAPATTTSAIEDPTW